jgi:hypothetical protein
MANEVGRPDLIELIQQKIQMQQYIVSLAQQMMGPPQQPQQAEQPQGTPPQ